MKTSGRLALAIALVLVVGLSLFLIPRQAIMSLTTTITKTKPAPAAGQPDFYLGETINFVGTINFAGGESRNITGVTLDITGPQPLTMTLPINPGTHNLTADLPKDGSNQPLGTLTATVASQNIQYVGYGYGYGYAGAGGGSITYTIAYKPPVYKYPAPAGQAPPLQGPASAFSIPGVGEGDASITVNYVGPIPGAPGAAPGSLPIGLTQNPYTGSFIALVRGSPVDVLLDLYINGGIFLNSFKALDQNTTGVTGGINNAQDVLIYEGNLFVVYGAPGQSKLRRIPIAEWGLNSSNPVHALEVNIPDSLQAAGLSAGFDPNIIYIAYFQSDPGLGIPIKSANVHGQGTVAPFVMLTGGPTGGGYKGLAYNPGPQVFMGANGNKLAEFKSDGFIKSTKTINTSNGAPASLTQVEGMTVSYNTLYLVDGPGAAIYSTQIQTGGPAAPAGVPRGMASDGTNLYIVIDGAGQNGNDGLMKVNASTGQQVGSTISLPSGDIESVAYLGNNLYVVSNEFGGNPKKLYKLNTSGQVASGYPKNLAGFIGDIGGLTVDTGSTKLVAAERWQNFLHVLNPDTGALENTLNLSLPPGGGQGMWLPGGLESVELVTQPDNTKVYLGAKYVNYFRINAQTGQVMAMDAVSPSQPPYDMTGLATPNPNANTTIYIADAATQHIYKAVLPGTPAPNPLADGSYQAVFTAQAAGISPTASSPLAFTIGKQTNPQITITSPVSGSASITDNITVTGTVNDPTITTASVGIALPSTELFNSGAEEATTNALNANWTAQGLWHVTSAGQAKKSGAKSWYYGQEPQFNYDTPGQPNSGDLNTKTLTIGQNTTLTFSTWYMTEPGFDFDRKLVQWVTASQTETIAQIIDFFPPPQPGQPFVPAQPGAVFQKNQFPGGMPGHVPNQLIFIPSGYIGGNGQPALVQVTLNLNALAGQTGKIRFKFDTFDAWGNNFEGWYIDNITLTGAGFEGTTVNVVNQAFSAPFTLAQGQNTVSASATRSAYDSTTVSTSVVVYLDSSVPTLTVTGLPTTTNNPVQTLSGTFVETTPDTLEIYQYAGLFTNPAATTSTDILATYSGSKLIVSQKSFTNNTYSKSVVLSEGTNSFLVRMTDKGGLKGQVIATSALDTTGPTLQVLATSYPTGEVSARPNDFFVYQVKATDANGIANVKMQMPNGPPQNFMARSDVPAAVLTQWGVNSQATHVFPMILPTSAPPGTYSLTATATDNGGNTSSAATSATVVSTLSKFNISLLPNWNLLSLPLMPESEAVDPNDSNAFLISSLAATLPSGSLNSVWTYDAATSQWKSYVMGQQSNDLTNMKNGRGYWVRMNASWWAADPARMSEPLAAGLPNTPVPIKLTISGVVLRPAETPPTYSLYANANTGGTWNLVGLHSERAKAVTTVLQPLTSQYGASLWGALVKYENFIYFPTQENAQPEVKLGSFKSMTSSDSWNPGEGAWIFVLPPGGSVVATP